MRPKVLVVDLTENQRQTLQQIVSTGRDLARKITRARVGLKAVDATADAQSPMRWTSAVVGRTGTATVRCRGVGRGITSQAATAGTAEALAPRRW